MFRALFLGFLLLTAGCHPQEPSAGSAGPPPSQLDELLQQIWQYQLKQDPLSANYAGEQRYNDRLPDLSPEALAAHQQQLQTFLQQLNALEPDSEDTAARVNWSLMQLAVQNDIDGYRFKQHYLPLTAEGGFHSNLAFLPSIMPFSTEQDYRNYLSRLRAIPAYFDQQMHWMQTGLASGQTQPKAVLEGFEHSITSFIVDDPADSPFFAPFRQVDLTLPVEEIAALKLEARQVIEETVIPAYVKYLKFFTEQYYPGARDTIGVSETDAGKSFYANRVAYYTTLPMTPRQVHNLGLEEVARIRAEMEQVKKQAGFDGDLAEFIEYLRTDPQFYPKSADELMRYAAWIAKRADAQLPRLFKTLPRTPYGVEPVPAAIAPKYTIGRYVSPSRDDQPGYYWVNTYALDKRPLYVFEALTLHEAVPGHHLQHALALEMEQVPEFRKHMYLSAFGEGWGLYSEFLGKEMGFYADPYTEFGRLSYEMWRACRLVVDTGMHAFGWSRERAIAFMQDNTALSKHNVRTEIDRYISWPGQAVSYKVGELTIRRLRTEAEQVLGEQFDVREFHDRVLRNGSVPLALLEQLVNEYIAEVAAQPLTAS